MGSSSKTPAYQQDYETQAEAINNAAAIQAKATTDAAKIASETADKNRTMYETLTKETLAQQTAIQAANTSLASSKEQEAIELSTQQIEYGISALSAANSQAQSFLQPYMAAGKASMSDLQGMLGQMGTAKQTELTERYLQSAPIQAAQRMGQAAVERSGAAQGLLGSGRVAEALYQKGQDIATLGLADYQNRLMSMTSLGQQASAQAGSFATQTAGAIATQKGNLAGIIAGTKTQLASSVMGSNVNMSNAMANTQSQYGQLIGQQNTYAGEANANAQLSLGNIYAENTLQNMALRLDYDKQRRAAGNGNMFGGMLNQALSAGMGTMAIGAMSGFA